VAAPLTALHDMLEHKQQLSQEEMLNLIERPCVCFGMWQIPCLRYTDQRFYTLSILQRFRSQKQLFQMQESSRFVAILPKLQPIVLILYATCKRI
jgi:hypothetical protein